MKILQINALYGDKSTGVIVKDIHVALQESSHQSWVAAAYVQANEDDLIPIGNICDHKWHAFLTRLTGKQGFYSKGATAKFLRRVEKEHPDIIHLHNVHSNFLNLPLLFAYVQKKNIPMVITLHDSWFFTGKCYHFLDEGCGKWKEECKACPKRRKEIPSILFDNSQKVFTKKKALYDMDNLHIVGCSKWITECAKQSPLLTKANFHQIYNGADTAVFAPQRTAENQGGGEPFTVLTMANKWFQPENAAVRDAILEWLNQGSRKLRIVGCLPEQLQAYTQENVVCEGYVQDKMRLAEIYNEADAFLNVTLVDTLPTVNIEAALCGTPIVTYDSGGSGELVQEGVTGYVVPPMDYGRAIEALEKIESGMIKRSDCASWGFANFEKSTNVRKYVDLYERIYNAQIKEGD